MVILYGRIELMVSGGIYGDVNNNNVKFFLGANMKLTRPVDAESRLDVYVLRSTLTDDLVLKEERLLQNYVRPASNYKWGFRSTRFCLKGFKTLNPLYTNIRPLERSSSLILRCLACNTFDKGNQEQIVAAIHETASTYSLSIARDQNDLVYLQLLKSMCSCGKLQVVISATISLIEGLDLAHNPQTVISGTTATSLYNDVVRYRCATTNNSAITNELYAK